ncbi:MAG: methyl-accepting chemotaxis protein [Oscillospiraceae bacterium]|nr:methyl-accepting chemotaxis protein [Oscillospiraceae bacterium]
MKIRARILSGFIVMAVVAVLLGAVGLISTIMLDGISTELKELQTESDGVLKVLNAHYVWRQDLTESILYGSEFRGSLDGGTCALGRWYDSDSAKNIRDPELLNLLKRIDNPHMAMHNDAKIVVEYLSAGNNTAAADYLEEDIYPKTEEVISILSEMQERYIDLVNMKDDESINIAELMQRINIVLIVIAVVVCVFMSLYISGIISKPIIFIADYMKKAGSTGDVALRPEESEKIAGFTRRKDEIADLSRGIAAFVGHVTNISKELETVANGDLTADIELLSDADVMGRSLKHMADSLNNMFSEIHASTEQVSSGSQQVAGGAQALAQGSTQQAASVEELSGSVAEIAERTKENAAIAERTAKLAESIIYNAEKGSRHMDEMMSAVRDINQASQSIGNVIKVIDDIAFQTNILALNAAVEAARAGQHGKGFAVVAEEVRNLASKSAEAAKQTGSMIENSIEKAELGSRIAGETAESLSEIVTGINESSRLVREIAEASEKQSSGINNINIGIDQVAQVIQQNSATAEESAAASEEMSGQSGLLQELISQFRLKDSEPGRLIKSSSRKGRSIIKDSEDDAPRSNPGFSSSGSDYGKY